MATAVRNANPSAMPQQMDDDAILREHDASEQRVIAELESAAPEALDIGWGARMVASVNGRAPRPTVARAVSTTVTTDDRHAVAAIVNEIDERPTLFAVRFLELLRRVEQMERDRIRLDVAEKCIDAITSRLNGEVADTGESIGLSLEDLRARVASHDATLEGLCMEAR